MSFIDRIRGLFGRKPSGAEYGAATTGGVVAATSGDSTRDVDEPAGSGGTEGGESDGGWGGGDGGGGGGDGGNG